MYVLPLWIDVGRGNQVFQGVERSARPYLLEVIADCTEEEVRGGHALLAIDEGVDSLRTLANNDATDEVLRVDRLSQVSKFLSDVFKELIYLLLLPDVLSLEIWDDVEVGEDLPQGEIVGLDRLHRRHQSSAPARVME